MQPDRYPLIHGEVKQVNIRPMSKKLEVPGRQQSARHSLGYSMRTTTFGMLGGLSSFLALAALARALEMNPATPAIKAGVGFFTCVTLACFATIW